MNYSHSGLGRLALFAGMNSDEIKQLCDCFDLRTADYRKGEIIVSEGEAVKRFAVVLAGNARSFKTDVSGKVFTVSVIEEGGYIGILLAGQDKLSPVTVEATDRLTVLSLPFEKVTRQCRQSCAGHSKLLNNFICGISQKAIHLYERIDCLIKPSMREKILAYMAQQPRLSQTKNAYQVILSFDREKFAEYLNADRSALSRELSAMKKEGIIDYHRNVFKIPL
ncbi:MAG: Crp/Fnr family transcriptional regulator [Oscillospiraceae bacterium]|nr:Crp/Fnr family transcriptional regulator [Oscillospiraceae bacterium]